MDLKLALCSGSFSNDIKTDRITIQDILGIAGKYEFNAVEIREDLFKNKDADLISIKQKASTIGLQLIYSYMNRVLHKSPDNTAKNCELIKSRIDEAKFLGCPILKVSFGEFNDYADISIDHVKCVYDLVKYAGQNEVVICVENSDGVTGGNPSVIKQFVNKISSPYFKTTYDCGNYAILGYDPVDALKLLNEDVVYVHLKDVKKGETKSTFIGNGDIDFVTIISMLKESRFKGHLCFEFGTSVDRLIEIEKSLICIKNMM